MCLGVCHVSDTTPPDNSMKLPKNSRNSDVVANPLSLVARPAILEEALYLATSAVCPG